jgi:hypothetical protein
MNPPQPLGTQGVFACPPKENAAKVITLFRSMTPAFQDYAMDQLGKLSELCASLKKA